MAIEWGGWVNHLRVGIDVWTDPYDTWTPSLNVYVAFYVQCDSSWNFDDSQTLTASGSVAGSWTFQNTLGANQVVHVGTATIANQAQSYGGGPTYTLTGALSGVYLGAGPSHTRYYTLPPRPPRTPSAPGTPGFSSRSATAATLSWSGSTDHGGSSLIEYQLEVSSNSSFTAVVHRSGGALTTSRQVTGLAPSTPYWARVRSRNGVGWSGWSGVSSASTLTYPSAPTVSGIGPDAATVSWPALPAGDALIGYQVQYALDAGFTSGLQTITSTSWGTSRTLSGLSPATGYWVRVRGQASSGWGAWSDAATFQTLSGAKVAVGGAWVDATAAIADPGTRTYVPAEVRKGVAGAYVL